MVEMNDCLDEFGKVFIEEVRDRSIRLFDKSIQGLMNDASSQELSERVKSLNDEDRKLINEIIPDIVDLCIHNMLCLFEEHDDIKIIMNNYNINDMSDGLSGELYTSGGWIAKFSKQRYSGENRASD